jgi:DNA replication protein DnaD
MEEAAAYTQQQNLRFSRVGRIMEILQIRGRNLTAPEKRYIKQWLEMDFDEETIGLAYERSCINTGGLAWPYMHKILTRWQAAGLLRAEDVRNKDVKPVPKGASGELAAEDYEAIQRLLQEG